jgi:hypothetical protein
MKSQLGRVGYLKAKIDIWLKIRLVLAPSMETTYGYGV